MPTAGAPSAMASPHSLDGYFLLSNAEERRASDSKAAVAAPPLPCCPTRSCLLALSLMAQLSETTPGYIHNHIAGLEPPRFDPKSLLWRETWPLRPNARKIWAYNLVATSIDGWLMTVAAKLDRPHDDGASQGPAPATPTRDRAPGGLRADRPG